MLSEKIAQLELELNHLYLEDLYNKLNLFLEHENIEKIKLVQDLQEDTIPTILIFKDDFAGNLINEELEHYRIDSVSDLTISLIMNKTSIPFKKGITLAKFKQYFKV